MRSWRLPGYLPTSSLYISIWPARFCSLILACAASARLLCSKILGTTYAMIPASSTNTVTISRMVKPRWSMRADRERFFIGKPFSLDRNVEHGKHRREDGDDDEADDAGHDDDHDRLDE